MPPDSSTNASSSAAALFVACIHAEDQPQAGAYERWPGIRIDLALLQVTARH
jgi:hypothetical protein